MRCMFWTILFALIYAINTFQISPYGGLEKKILGLNFRRETGHIVPRSNFHNNELFAQKKGFFSSESKSLLKKILTDLVQRVSKSVFSKESVSEENNEEKKELIDFIMLQRIKFSRIGSVAEDELAHSSLENKPLKKHFTDLVQQLSKSKESDGEENNEEKKELIDFIMLQRIKFSQIGSVAEDEFGRSLENKSLRKLSTDLVQRLSKSILSKESDGEKNKGENKELIDFIMLQKLKFSSIGSATENELAHFVYYLPDFMANVTFGKERWIDFMQDKYYPTKEKASYGDTDAMAELENMRSRMKLLWDVDLYVLVRAYENEVLV